MKEFDPWHSQLDYETNIVEVQYDGELNEEKAIEYAKQSYSQIEGIIIYNFPPDEVKGYKNCGVIGIK